jgi:hypothetical protein
MRHSIVKLLAALALLALPGSALADVTFVDGTFTPGDYVTTSTYTPDGASVTEGQCTSCGVGSSDGEQFVITFPANSSTADTGILNTTFTYDPATQGAITSISASVDKDLSITPTPTAQGGNTFRPMVEQGGVDYVAAIPGPPIPLGDNTTGYNTLSNSSLTASDFTEFNFTTGVAGTSHPNFDGSTITFGIAQESGVAPGQTEFIQTVDYDNLTFSIAGVPEPATWAMMLLGFFGLGVLLREHRRADRELDALAAG